MRRLSRQKCADGITMTRAMPWGRTYVPYKYILPGAEFDSLVWGSFRLAPINKIVVLTIVVLSWSRYHELAVIFRSRSLEKYLHAAALVELFLVVCFPIRALSSGVKLLYLSQGTAALLPFGFNRRLPSLCI